MEFENNSNYDNTSIVTEIKKLMKTIKMPLNLIGYPYVVKILEYMVTSNRITSLKEFYNKISQENITTLNCVEAAVRNVINKTLKCNSSNLRKILGISESTAVSNSIFLSASKEVVLEKLTKNKNR